MFPDGRVVFVKPSPGADGNEDWVIAEKDGKNPRKLVSFPSNIGHVSVSPDGQRIILIPEQPGNRRLFEIAADGTGLHEIRRLGEDERNFRWTPDGKYLVYQAGTASQSDIWLLPMETAIFSRPGNPIRLTNGPLPYSRPCSSRDGKRIFVFGTKARGELVRYDLKSKQFVPFLGGISATDPTFSRDGRWVAYISFPDRTLWRSRSDGSERMQLTSAPMNVRFAFISPDGTKVAFHTQENELFEVSTEGGEPQKIADNASFASWSPDQNYLFNSSSSPPYRPQIVDMRSGKSFGIPASNSMNNGFWLTQDTLIAPNQRGTDFVTFNLKTQELNNLTTGISGGIEHWMLSPDGKYMFFTTAGAEQKVMRLGIADHQLETITSLNDFHRAVDFRNTQISVAPDGSPVLTLDTGYQEIYALNMRWP
jgi:Tol biopolymer transport system component